MPQRDRSLDVAKGIAILAIVLGHVERGLLSAGVEPPSVSAIATLDRGLYSWDLAVFAAASGMTMSSSLSRRGTNVYLRSRLESLLYLYVLWTLLQGCVKVLAGGLANDPVDVWQALAALWRADTQMWFLGYLCVATVVLVVARPWSSRRRWTLILAALVSVALWGTNPALLAGSHLSFIFTQGWGLLIFSAGGAAVGLGGMTALNRRAGRWQPLVALVLALLFVAALFAYPACTVPTESLGRTVGSVASGLLVSFLGTAAVFATSSWLARYSLGGALAWLGRRSLAVFAAHVVALAFVRVVLQRAGVESFVVQLTAGLLAGVLLPIALWWLSQRRAFRWLFEPPRCSADAQSVGVKGGRDR